MWYFTDGTPPYPRRACPCGSAARWRGTRGRFGRARVPGSRGQDAGSGEDPRDAEPRQGRALLGQSSPRRGHTRRSRKSSPSIPARRRRICCSASRTASSGAPDLMGEAVAELRQALEINPEFVPARYYLAHIYLDLGRNERAREELQAALATAPRNAQFLTLARRSRTATEEPAPRARGTAAGVGDRPRLESGALLPGPRPPRSEPAGRSDQGARAGGAGRREAGGGVSQPRRCLPGREPARRGARDPQPGHAPRPRAARHSYSAGARVSAEGAAGQSGRAAEDCGATGPVERGLALRRRNGRSSTNVISSSVSSNSNRGNSRRPPTPFARCWRWIRITAPPTATWRKSICVRASSAGPSITRLGPRNWDSPLSDDKRKLLQDGLQKQGKKPETGVRK